jgi:GGDEF domain-containing protein
LQKVFGLDKHIISRWGGDEFAVIYYGDQYELAQKLETLKELFSVYACVYEKTMGISTSIVSINEYEQVSQTLMAADHLLYEEKQKKPGNENSLDRKEI